MKKTLCVFVVLGSMCIASAQVTAVRAGRLIDPDSGPVLTDQVSVPAHGVEVADGGRLVDGEGLGREFHAGSIARRLACAQLAGAAPAAILGRWRALAD